jgi:hypothetical protein
MQQLQTRAPAPEHPLETPVALIIFNRPKETARAIAAIRAVRPKRLFVIADGPRNDLEKTLCDETRAVVETAVDWPCDVQKNYSATNLGCGMRPVTGITWVFEHAEAAIIVEDDCIPDPSFFYFAEELLRKYANDERVMHVAASSFQENNPQFHIRESYYESFLPNCFGCWATWRRAWKHYDYDIRQWPVLRDSGALAKAFGDPAAYERFERTWNDYYEKRIVDSWDGQWHFACMSRNAFCLTPSVNLVRNIGFNERGTHTKQADRRSDLPVHPMPFPLVHPSTLAFDRGADAYTFRFYFGIDQKLRYRVLRPVKNLFPGGYAWMKRMLKGTSD